MAAYDLIAAASTDALASRVTLFAMEAAINIANEDVGTTDHAARIALAYKLMKGEVNTKLLTLAAIASNATLQATINAAPGNYGSDISDSDLQFVVNGLMTQFANAYAAA